MSGAIQERAAVGPLAALDGAWDTNELRFKGIASDANDCIPVASHIHKGNVRLSEP
jgi:hypothetical protein